MKTKCLMLLILVICISCVNNQLNDIADSSIQTRALDNARFEPGEVYTGWHVGFDNDLGRQLKSYSVRFSQDICNITGLSTNHIYYCQRYTGTYTVTFDPNLWEFSPAPSPECGFNPEANAEEPQERGYTYKILEPGKVELSSYVYYINYEHNDNNPWWNTFAPCRRGEILFRWYLTRLR